MDNAVAPALFTPGAVLFVFPFCEAFDDTVVTTECASAYLVASIAYGSAFNAVSLL